MLIPETYCNTLAGLISFAILIDREMHMRARAVTGVTRQAYSFSRRNILAIFHADRRHVGIKSLPTARMANLYILPHSRRISCFRNSPFTSCTNRRAKRNAYVQAIMEAILASKWITSPGEPRGNNAPDWPPKQVASGFSYGRRGQFCIGKEQSPTRIDLVRF